MAIVINGSNKGNFIANNKQLQKVYANGVLVWENWKPWSDGASGVGIVILVHQSMQRLTFQPTQELLIFRR